MRSVILSGGNGTRLWPLSRAAHPKQFISFRNSKTLFQETILRAKKSSNNNFMVIGSARHKSLILNQCKDIGVKAEKIILEPFGRNTAAAICMACIANQDSDDELLLVMPADHVIEDSESFNKAIEKAIVIANQGKIVTFGIIPNKVHTGFGYIEVAEKNNEPSKVVSFTEKPNEIKAKSYLEGGKHYWNSGIFLFKASAMLSEISKHALDIKNKIDSCLKNAVLFDNCISIKEEDFYNIPNISIDYAVMEKSDNVYVVPMSARWNDLGSWDSLIELEKKDENENYYTGNVVMENVKNTYVRSEKNLVALLGVEDLVVVETSDAILIAKKNQSENVKSIVNKLLIEEKYEAENNRIVQRPWGYYESIDRGERYQVKRIRVFPGEALSVQMHHHRAEHWIIVAGTAKVYIDGEVSILTENQSIYVPLGAVHSLENPGILPLDMIEVQSGAYLGEDDIVRYSDKYGRLEVK